VSLISRYLEENGTPTVVIGTARDIVEHCGVARFLFVDFPLGSPCGEPGAVGQQREVFQMALDLLSDATAPRTIREAGYSWSGGDDWKRLIFTEEQPFQDEEAKAQWEARNDEYRRLKSEGKI
jgi:D-proline reductase (dithiol) PrdB